MAAIASPDKPDIMTAENRDVYDQPDSEKVHIARTIADINVLGLGDDDAEFYNNFEAERRKKLVRKVSYATTLSLGAPC